VSFVNTLFLAAIGAMALPVLFHFVRRMRARTIVFSSLMFLTATPKELVKKRRLRDILLMTLRALVLGLLAFAFARPFIPPERLPFVATAENESVVFLLDASYSMGADGGFERAKQEILRRIDAAHMNDEMSVIVFSDHAEQLTELGAEPELHRQVVQSVAALSSRGTDFYEPLRVASEVLRDARHRQKRVVLVSDLQQIGWSGPLDNWNLEPGVAFDPILVGPDSPLNRFIDELAVNVRRTSTEALVEFEGRAEARGAVDAPGSASVTLSLNGRTVEETPISGGESARFSFRRVAERDGFVQGSATLSADDLLIDDNYYFTYEVAPRPTVLVVDGSARRVTGSTRSDGFFLERALSLGANSVYSFEESGRARLGALPSSYALVMVTNVPSLTEREVSGIVRYVEQGGNVVLSFGDNVEAAAYSRSLQALGVGSLQGVVTPSAVQGANAIVGQVDWRHPVFEPFAGPGGGAILRPQFRRYAEVEPAAGTLVVGTFDTGAPMLLERRVGSGSVLVYTSTFSNAWTDLPINEMFVPFVYQLAKHATEDNTRRLMFSVGEIVPLGGSSGSEWVVLTPTGDQHRVSPDSSGNSWYTRTEVPGHYVASRSGTRVPFSVNLNTVESELAPRGVEEAYAGVVSPSSENTAAMTATGPVDEATAFRLEEKEQKLWRWVLLLAIALFALETVLANRPGKKGVALADVSSAKPSRESGLARTADQTRKSNQTRKGIYG
jgi:hypothetical protein